MAKKIKNDPLGKTKTEKFDRTVAKEMAVEAVHKRYPVIPKKLIRNRLEKAEKKIEKKTKKGFAI